jgi:hypothetical protein
MVTIGVTLLSARASSRVGGPLCIQHVGRIRSSSHSASLIQAAVSGLVQDEGYTAHDPIGHRLAFIHFDQLQGRWQVVWA